ncbi:CRM-domain containing factor CFM3, chloroplastic/mitochondrial isoform X2 [Humulus lupulus]|uniref:CRM-domain containing factor CFM3, chloroplastic/mitochondrial isoform X2 n=1 Tax=Humulus lupulus TaxID=3486 RepID=UPI002B4128DE|nr:CRM-domain containing factor CFM3, chloroplastic/mitochondrial isoform X2 [Humulus lupulus]
MALSPFSPNPSTSLSLSSSSSSSCNFIETQSLHLLLLQSQTHSVAYRALKFRTCCAQQVVQVDTLQQPERIKVAFETKKQRKKRKPRPSFLEQIQYKWSAKPGSLREKFPWQEQKEEEQEQEEAKEEDKENGSKEFTDAYVIETENKPSLSGSVNFVSPSSVISAPWDHGKKPVKREVKPETEIPQNVEEFNGLNHNGAKKPSSILQREFLYGNNGVKKPSSTIQREFQSTSDGISKEERTVSMDVNGFSLDETPSGSGENVNLADSDYDSDDSESELGEGEKVTRRRSNTVMAEKMLPEHELKRLRNVSLRMLERTKVGAAGITQALVDAIHDKWKLDEVVKLKFQEPLSSNMRRTHKILETKTGGLIIWRSGSSVVLYRGMNYKFRCVQSYTKQIKIETPTLPYLEDGVTRDAIHNIQEKDSSVRTKESSSPIPEERVKGPPEGDIKNLNDLNHLLDELGPRYMDWLGQEPFPVDADLLPAVIPNYKPPFRLLPYGVKLGLRNREMTAFRRIARTMPPHFALGRNRELQGLARAIVKLWEKSAIAKIAIKRGVQNTCNERMAEELKTLTGGTLLSRNKDFIVFYRGNDFLPPVVTDALKERKKLRDLQQDKEEQARKMAPAFIELKSKVLSDQLVAGTLAESKAAIARWGKQPTNVDIKEMIKESTLARRASILRHLEKRLSLAKGKLKIADKALAKVQKNLDPSELPDDLETLTDEERFLFRKMGLSMKPFLVLGRRGVYDGTVENMHLHWKYRELVKIFVRGKSLAQVTHFAISLEAESKGLLVSIDKTTKGIAIIVYRGKNYQSPLIFRPKNLLTRRQALAQSVELQRREALRHYISDLMERIELLKSEMEEESRNGKMTNAEGSLQKTMEYYLSSKDEETEDDEGDEPYLEMYDSADEDEDDYKEHEETRQINF